MSKSNGENFLLDSAKELSEREPMPNAQFESFVEHLFGGSEFVSRTFEINAADNSKPEILEKCCDVLSRKIDSDLNGRALSITVTVAELNETKEEI